MKTTNSPRAGPRPTGRCGVVEPWLAGRWCRRFVVNLKFGRTDPPALLRELRAPGSALARHAGGAVIAVLHHNRDEFTVAGTRT